MPTETELASVRLSAAELSWLLAYHKTTLSPGTIFADAMQANAESGVQARLEKSLFLDDQFGDAFRRAVKTEPQLMIRDAALDAVSTGFYFEAAGELAGLLVWKHADGNYVLTFPLDTAQMLNKVSEILDPVEAAPPPAFEVVFPAPAVAAWAAAIDYLRTLFAASLLERQGLAGVALRRSDIQSQLSSGYSHQDYRSLVTLLNAFIPSQMSAGSDTLDKGIEQLIDLGFLLKTNGRPDSWGPAGPLVAMALNMLIPLPALSLTAKEGHAGQDSSAPNPLIAMRGRSLWLFNVLTGTEGTSAGVRVRGVDGLTMMIELQRFLKAPHTPVEPETHSEADTAAGATGVRAASELCTTCGNQLKPGAKFCTSCGTRVQPR